MTEPIRWTIILASGDRPLVDVKLRETFGGDRRKAERDAVRRAELLNPLRTFCRCRRDPSLLSGTEEPRLS